MCTVLLCKRCCPVHKGQRLEHQPWYHKELYGNSSAEYAVFVPFLNVDLGSDLLHIAMRNRKPRRELLKSMYIVRTLYPVYRMYEEWRASSVALYWGIILGRNPAKNLKSFLPCYSQSLLQLCLEISISSDSHDLLQFLLYTVKEKGGKPDRKPYPFPLV